MLQWAEVVQPNAAAAGGGDDTLAGLVVEEDLGTWRSKTTVVRGGDIVVVDADIDEAVAVAAERRPVVPVQACIAHGLVVAVVVEEEPRAADDAGNDAGGGPPVEVHRRSGEGRDACAAEPAAGAWRYRGNPK